MEQRIKQEHQHSQKNDGKTVHKQKNRVMELIAEMWPAYLIEIFVIILGIWITLALEQWRDNGKENQLEKIYQKNLLSDVSTDLSELKSVIEETQNILKKDTRMLDFVKDPAKNPVTVTEAESDLQAILARPKFITSDATFSDLKNSGNLRLLKDIHLKNLLFSYYNIARDIKEVQDAEQQTTIVITGPYFIKHFAFSDIGKQGISQQELQRLSGDIEFDNNLLLRRHNRSELLEGYQKANKLAGELKQTLEERVKE